MEINNKDFVNFLFLLSKTQKNVHFQLLKNQLTFFYIIFIYFFNLIKCPGNDNLFLEIPYSFYIYYFSFFYQNIFSMSYLIYT